ncbi:MAG: HAMP domain-containing protein [Halioglobus sp.]|nr:HAMP domain-containing protein [Halioglobus sp.]
MRGNLFLKMFTAFWLVIIAVLASWLLSSNYFDTRAPGPAHLPSHRANHPLPPPHRVMLKLIYDLQNAESGELRGVIERAQRRQNITIYLLNDQGEELFGEAPPAAAVAVADEVRGRRRRALSLSPAGRFSAHAIYRSDYGPLRAVFAFSRGQRPVLAALGDNPWLRLLLAILVSGVVCFALSRALTNRLATLRRASRRLANGDLDTRIQVRAAGGDETDELARDFNSMAGQLQDRMQAQKRLLSDVSHELRSPLARLRIALALAQEQPDTSAAQLDRIERETERLEELIGQLLSTRPQDVPLDTHIDLVALLRHLCADAAFEGTPGGKTIRFECTLDEAVVASHSDLLHKACDNVLRNALAHTGDNTAVTVQLERSGSNYRIRVRDRGPGVPDEALDKIFEEFYRVDDARSRDTGGHGLGLAIARRAVEQHGGAIHARNCDDGLEITLDLPVQS